MHLWESLCNRTLVANPPSYLPRVPPPMIPYECANCGAQGRVRNGRTNGSERILKACESCESVTTHEATEITTEDMSIIEREYLRQEYPTVYVSREANTSKTYHIPSASGKYCYRQCKTREISIDKYPLGYWDWCQTCLKEVQNESLRQE